MGSGTKLECWLRGRGSSGVLKKNENPLNIYVTLFNYEIPKENYLFCNNLHYTFILFHYVINYSIKLKEKTHPFSNPSEFISSDEIRNNRCVKD